MNIKDDAQGAALSKRDDRGRFKRGVSGNPNGCPSVKRMTADRFIEAFRGRLGDDFPTEIVKLALEQTQKGNASLLCKILDKILPSKTESKHDISTTHREEFLKMRARAVTILRSMGAKLN